MATLLEVEGLSKTFDDVEAVKGLSLKVGAGEIVGLVGPNGAGKTTALRCICTIMRPDEGRISVCGHDVWTDGIEARRQLGFVPEVPNPFDKLTVTDHLEFTARAYSVDGYKEKARRLLELFDMGEKQNELSEKLSKGMKQKILIMCAFLHDPKVLLLDEPLIGIDPKGARALKDRVRDLASRGGCVVISSHILSLVEELCGRVAIMVKGRIIAEGTIDELRSDAHLKSDATLEDAFLAVTAGVEESRKA